MERKIKARLSIREHGVFRLTLIFVKATRLSCNLSVSVLVTPGVRCLHKPRFEKETFPADIKQTCEILGFAAKL